MTGQDSPALAGFTFPTVAHMHDVARMERDHRPGELNLKSCELLNPAVLDWHAAKLAALDAQLIVSYPLTTTATAATAAAFARNDRSVLLTPGSDYAIHIVTAALGAPAGRLVIADPRFVGWDQAASRSRVVIDNVPARPGMTTAIEQLIDQMRSGGPCVAVVTQPDSISGHSFTEAELSVLAGAAEEHGSMLVIDTCYLAFSDDAEASLGGIDHHPHVIRINSFSKCFGLAGCRVGAIMASVPVIDYLSRWNSESLVNGIGLHLLTEALSDRPFFAGVYREVRAARAMLAEAAPRLIPGWKPRQSQANFVAFDVPAGTGRGTAGRLRAAGIRTRPLTGITGFADGIRIATPSVQAVDQVLAALAGQRDGACDRVHQMGEGPASEDH